MQKLLSFFQRKISVYLVFVSPAKQKRDICTAFPLSAAAAASAA